MPDFSKCVGGECPKKEKCFRFTCNIKSERQAYFSLPPYSKESGICAYFWDNDGDNGIGNRTWVNKKDVLHLLPEKRMDKDDDK